MLCRLSPDMFGPPRTTMIFYLLKNTDLQLTLTSDLPVFLEGAHFLTGINIIPSARPFALFLPRAKKEAELQEEICSARNGGSVQSIC